MSDERTTHGENSIHIENSTVHGHVLWRAGQHPERPQLPQARVSHPLPAPPQPQLYRAGGATGATAHRPEPAGGHGSHHPNHCGLGGVGKTQLALAYAHQHKGAYELAWWLDGSDGLTIDLGLQTLGRRLNLPLPADDFAAMRQIVLSAVNSMAQRWLLIYDNVDSLPPHELQPYLPSGKGSVLITSRNPRWGNMAVLSLPVFTPAESEAFWQKRLGAG